MPYWDRRQCSGSRTPGPAIRLRRTHPKIEMSFPSLSFLCLVALLPCYLLDVKTNFLKRRLYQSNSCSALIIPGYDEARVEAGDAAGVAGFDAAGAAAFLFAAASAAAASFAST